MQHHGCPSPSGTGLRRRHNHWKQVDGELNFVDCDGDTGWGWWFMGSILCPSCRCLYFLIDSVLQGKTPFVSQSAWTRIMQGELQKITQNLDPLPWIISRPAPTPESAGHTLCVNRGESYWWFNTDSHSNVTLDNISLIEDSINDIEFTSRSTFYTDVCMSSDNF